MSVDVSLTQRLAHPRPAVRTPWAAAPGPSTSALLDAVRGGDPRAWRQLHQRLNGLVVATARRAGLPPAECDDVAQTTWLRLFEHVDAIRNDVAVPRWLVTTATREAHAVSRRRKREVSLDPSTTDVPAPVEDLDEALDVKRYAKLVRTAVSTLPARERSLVVLLLRTRTPSYREISEALNMPIGAIGPVRQRALRRLRARLEGETDLAWQ